MSDPLLIAKAEGGKLALTWGPSCNISDQDYEIYEGPLGEFAKHVPLVFSDPATEPARIRAMFTDEGLVYAPPRAVGAGRWRPPA